ncbi:hypothetical protein RJG79_00480 [Mycoplasmatota bacterium WC44]
MNTFKLRKKHDKNYFEGWYVRLLSDEYNYAIIFGITYYVDNPHAFIQFTDTKDTKYFKFDLDQVEATDFCIRIGHNYLSTTSLFLKLENINIDVVFDNLVPLKTRLINNSIMDILYYLPLECYQEVVYLDGNFIDKNLKIGKTYVEKTYGRKFPKEWVWIQSHYPLSLAAAKMPLLLNRYGFYCLFEFDNKQYIFSTYKFGKIKITKKDNKVFIIIKQRKFLLKLELTQENTFKLMGPSDNGRMNITVNESLESILKLEFYKKKKLLTQSTTTNVGCEVEKNSTL